MIRIRKPWDLKDSQVTDEALYRERRRFLQGSAALLATAAAPGLLAPRSAAAVSIGTIASATCLSRV